MKGVGIGRPLCFVPRGGKRTKKSPRFGAAGAEDR